MPAFPAGANVKGGQVSASANTAYAMEFYAPIIPVVVKLHHQGLSLRAIGRELKNRGITSRYGCTEWSAAQVRKVLIYAQQGGAVLATPATAPAARSVTPIEPPAGRGRGAGGEGARGEEHHSPAASEPLPATPARPVTATPTTVTPKAAVEAQPQRAPAPKPVQATLARATIAPGQTAQAPTGTIGPPDIRLWLRFQVVGPFSEFAVKAMLRDGKVTLDTKYRRQPADAWRPLRDLLGEPASD